MSVNRPIWLESVATRVESRLSEFLKDEQDRWSSLDSDLNAPLGELTRLVAAGGKRLRPAFAYWAFVALGGEPSDERIIEVGSAIELLHGFALFHDDIMDGADSRRGVPTTHVTLAEHHQAER